MKTVVSLYHDDISWSGTIATVGRWNPFWVIRLDKPVLGKKYAIAGIDNCKGRLDVIRHAEKIKSIKRIPKKFLWWNVGYTEHIVMEGIRVKGKATTLDIGTDALKVTNIKPA